MKGTPLPPLSCATQRGSETAHTSGPSGWGGEWNGLGRGGGGWRFGWLRRVLRGFEAKVGVVASGHAPA